MSFNYANEDLPPSPKAPLPERLTWALEFAADEFIRGKQEELWQTLTVFWEVDRLLNYAQETCTSARHLARDLAEVHAASARAQSEFWSLVRAGYEHAPWRAFWGRR